MLKFHVENKLVIFLDHCELINKTYQENLKENTQRYTLKAELFAFHEKSKKQQCYSTLRGKKRKGPEVIDELNEDSKQTAWITKVLQQLKAEIPFPKGTTLPDCLTRYWEEIHEFPQFNGSNATTEFQSFSFNNNQQQEYIIPPRCKLFNYDIVQLPKVLPQLTKYDLIIMDPPWRNKYIRRLKRARHELGYHMLYDEELQKMPIAQLIHGRTLVAIWCTNSPQHQDALIKQLLPSWDLRVLHTIKWFKLNTSGEMICQLNETYSKKKPYEHLYIACHKDTQDCDAICNSLKDVEVLLSIPSIIHSHKPPLLTLFSEYLPSSPQCLEIFARYLQPHFTSIGMEVLKLMDKRLYNCFK